MYDYLKPKIDFFLAITGIIVLSPMLLVIIVLIRIDSRGPIFFKQKRVGKNKILFDIYKFRTMKVDTPSNIPTHMLENPDQYITKIGKLLRITSLDELPQLINIIKGDMSIVGPRPALWNQDDLIIERDKYGVNDFIPGLTGWAQISGRDEVSISFKARLDGFYCKHKSLRFDIIIILKTILIVCSHKGIREGR